MRALESTKPRCGNPTLIERDELPKKKPAYAGGLKPLEEGEIGQAALVVVLLRHGRTANLVIFEHAA